MLLDKPADILRCMESVQSLRIVKETQMLQISVSGRLLSSGLSPAERSESSQQRKARAPARAFSVSNLLKNGDAAQIPCDPLLPLRRPGLVNAGAFRVHRDGDRHVHDFKLVDRLIPRSPKAISFELRMAFDTR